MAWPLGALPVQIREARLAVFRWVTRYHTRRRHSGLGYISPIAFEQRSVTLAAAA